MGLMVSVVITPFPLSPSIFHQKSELTSIFQVQTTSLRLAYHVILSEFNYMIQNSTLVLISGLILPVLMVAVPSVM